MMELRAAVEGTASSNSKDVALKPSTKGEENSVKQGRLRGGVHSALKFLKNPVNTTFYALLSAAKLKHGFFRPLFGGNKKKLENHTTGESTSRLKASKWARVCLFKRKMNPELLDELLLSAGLKRKMDDILGTSKNGFDDFNALHGIQQSALVLVTSRVTGPLQRRLGLNSTQTQKADELLRSRVDARFNEQVAPLIAALSVGQE